MIKLELSQTELNELVRVIGKLSGAPTLNKLENFRLQDGNRIAFDQKLSTTPLIELSITPLIELSITPLIELSVDSSGRLLIDIIRLADSGIGNFFLQMFENKITGIIADKSNGKLHKESSSQLSLAPSKVLPLKTRFKKVSIQNEKLILELSTD